MMEFSTLIQQDRLFGDVMAALREQRTRKEPLPLVVNGLSEGALDAFLGEMAKQLVPERTPLLLLASSEEKATQIADNLARGGLRTGVFPKRTPVYYEYAASHDIDRVRLFVLHEWMEGKLDVLVTTPGAASDYTIPRGRFAASCLSIALGGILDPVTLAQKLTHMGYVSVETVEGAGQFAHRGGIVDFFPASYEAPFRIEFFGDEVDRICRFDPLTQRVTQQCDNICLLPACEVVIDSEAKERLIAAVEEQLTKVEAWDKAPLAHELEALRANTPLLARDKYISLIYPEKETLLHYLPPKTPICLVGTNEVREQLMGALAKRKTDLYALVEKKLLSPSHCIGGIGEQEYKELLKEHIPVHINAFGAGILEKEGGLFGFRTRRLPVYLDGLNGLKEDVTAFLKNGYTLYLAADSKGGLASTLSYLEGENIPCAQVGEGFRFQEATPGVVYCTLGNIPHGFDLITPKIAVLSMGQEGESAPKKLHTRVKPKHKPGETILSYAELKPGDLVVHERYGIGLFEGLERITQDKVTKDYITIRYAGTDKLFIPADQLDSVSKYIGAGGDIGHVKLSRMGSQTWQKAKSRAKGAAKEMAKELIALYAERQRKPGIEFPPQEEMENEFHGGFDYELTDPQMVATQDILGDMSRPVPMDRLLCGDVGFGKTEVALRAAFRAIANGYQAAILVPTTILALQHYETARSRMRNFAIRVDMLSRFRTPKEQAAVKRRLEKGTTDLVIGTHSLLGGQVAFRKLGLLIIDEEQRFGVAQKEKIKELAKNIDVLTLSATPIPRTLNMAISGIRDMSILDEAPGERRPVQTYVMEYHDEVIQSAMEQELARGGQVLYLYNDTENIDLIAGRWQQKLPHARIAYAHGQMDKEEVEDIWQSLVKGEIDILVCTTIVETGIDLPNANTMIVENADRLGLSQLHQLRGRIGRSSRQAYAYFTYRAGKALTDIAAKRLAAIREYAEFGAGFRIALRDLEIRGAGDLLGASQHGHIETVGYDMYVRLLENAVLEEQGIAKAPLFESTVEIGEDANIPPAYIASSTLRMEMYKKIAAIRKEEDVEEVLDEFFDRFGEPPKETVRLLYVALARAIASRLEIPLVEEAKGEIRLHVRGLDLVTWSEVYHQMEGVRLPSQRESYLSVKVPKGKDPAQIAAKALMCYETAKKGANS